MKKWEIILMIAAVALSVTFVGFTLVKMKYGRLEAIYNGVYE